MGDSELYEGLFRESAGRMVSTLTRILGSRHLELAEECVQDAMIKAMEKWPFHGVPENPQAWLIQAAKNRALDVLRRDQKLVAKVPEVECMATTRSEVDDELGMVFLCCHPALSRESQVALTLKTVGGLGVSEIARAYLVQDSTIAQRLVRAKKQIREQGIEFDLPQAMADAPNRLDAVLEALYLLFNEGYSLRSRELAEEAIRLCRMLTTGAATAWPKCHALLSLMLLQSARDAARIDADGGLNLMEQQDRSLWDRGRIGEGMLHLDLASNGNELTRYHVEAAIASIHSLSKTWESTDWVSIAASYELLERLHPTPVVRLNRAIAVGQCSGPEAGIELLEGYEDQLRDYHPYYSAMGSFCQRLQRNPEAIHFYEQAVRYARTEGEKSLILRRIGQVLGGFKEGSTNNHPYLI
jgi:RNA polymerase sigma-70 factor (ECF subfamily)